MVNVFNYCTGQVASNTVDWSEKCKQRGGFKILGINEKFVFVLNYNRETSLLKFDRVQKEVVDIAKIEFVKNSSCIINVKHVNGILEFILFSDNGAMPFLELIYFDTKLMRVVDSERLLDLEKEVELVEDNNSFVFKSGRIVVTNKSHLTDWSVYNKTIQFAISEDERFLFFKQRIKRKGYTNDLITVFDLEKNKVINQITFEVSPKRKSRIKNIYVDEHGVMYVLRKHYFNQAGREAKNKKPHYTYKIWKKTIDDSIVELEIPVGDFFITSSDLIKDAEGRIYVSMLYAVKEKKNSKGIFLTEVDSNFQDFVQINHVSSGLEKGKEELKENYQIIQTIKTNDRFVVIYRNREYKIEKDGSVPVSIPLGSSAFVSFGIKNGSSPQLEYKNTVFEIFDEKLNLIHSNAINHCGKSSKSEAFLGYHFYYNNSAIWTYANIDEKSFEKLFNEKAQTKSYPSKHNLFVRMNIALEGKITFTKLSPDLSLNVSLSARKSHKGIDYLIGVDNNWKNVRLGSVLKAK